MVVGEPGNETRFDVTNGLQPSFQQHFVKIDVEENTYVKLGEVKRSVIVTPSLD